MLRHWMCRTVRRYSRSRYVLILGLLLILATTMYLKRETDLLSAKITSRQMNLGNVLKKHSNNNLLAPSTISLVGDRGILIPTAIKEHHHQTISSHHSSNPAPSHSHSHNTIRQSITSSTASSSSPPSLQTNFADIPQSPIFDPSSIKIMPKHPVVPEGHPLQISCMCKHALLHRQTDKAPYLTFDLPPMSFFLEQRINIILRAGVAVLRFRNVRKGHEGQYNCRSTDGNGTMKFNTVDLSVIERDLPEEEDEESELELDELALLESREFAGIDIDNENRKKTDKALKIAKDINHLHRHRARMAPNDDDGVDMQAKLQEFREKLRNVKVPPMDMTAMEQRGKFQQGQVQTFCESYNLDKEFAVLPSGNESSSTLYRHLLLNDKTQTMFCFVPKVGCTNLRVLFFIVQGYIPLSQLLSSRDSLDQERLEMAQFYESFYNRNNNQRIYALQHYYKFMMYRNPLERLVSGYRSKVQRYPLIGLDDETPHYNKLRKAILLHTRPADYRAFLRDRGQTPVNITFGNFIDYWAGQPEEIKFDEHFTSILKMCQPCRTRYNFYGNFKNFDTDSRVLIEKIHAKPEFMRAGYYDKGRSTSELSRDLYAELLESQKKLVLSILAMDLDFYYHIFPEELDIHKALLGLDQPLPRNQLD